MGDDDVMLREWIDAQMFENFPGFRLAACACPVYTAMESDRPLTRRERLELAKENGIEVCPSCGYQHDATIRDKHGKLQPVPCIIDDDIWGAVVDVARGQGGG